MSENCVFFLIVRVFVVFIALYLMARIVKKLTQQKMLWNPTAITSGRTLEVEIVIGMPLLDLDARFGAALLRKMGTQQMKRAVLVVGE